MKRIKKFLRENKVLVVLAIIFLICMIILVSSTIITFYDNSKDAYGTRLDTTKNVPLEDDVLNKVKTDLQSDKTVTNVNILKKGKIVYIEIDFADDTKIDNAKKSAEVALTSFSEAQLKVYDIHFTINSKNTKDDNESYTLMGARNKNGSGKIIWNNNNKEESKK